MARVGNIGRLQGCNLGSIANAAPQMHGTGLTREADTAPSVHPDLLLLVSSRSERHCPMERDYKLRGSSSVSPCLELKVTRTSSIVSSRMSHPLCPTPARFSTLTPGLSPGPHSTAASKDTHSLSSRQKTAQICARQHHPFQLETNLVGVRHASHSDADSAMHAGPRDDGH